MKISNPVKHHDGREREHPEQGEQSARG